MITTEQARTMHTEELRRAAESDEVARGQLHCREAGAALVRGALVACGERHSGTGGWHIVPYVAPSGEIGYVDTARGRAYLTGVALDADTIEALTVPDQTPGPKASGAAAWSAPDAGGGASTEAPTGWLQLLVDIRTHAPVAEIVDAVPTLVAYGLVTCYSHRRGEPVERLVSDWPLDDDQRRRVQERASRWLTDALSNVGNDPGYPYRTDEAEVSVQLACGESGSALPGTVRWALREYALTRVSNAAGEWNGVLGARVIDAISRAIEARLIEQMAPVARALPAALQGNGVTFSHRCDVLRAAGAHVLRAILAPHHEGATALLASLENILYEHGAVVTPEGVERGVTCTSPPPKPQATRGELRGTEVWHVPFGADYPPEFSHCLVMSVSHEIRCRPEDAEKLRP